MSDETHSPESDAQRAKSEYAARWRDNNRDRIKEQNARWKRDNPHKVKEMHLKRQYGIDLAEYNRMYSACGGQCQICRKPIEHITSEASRTEKACVDHCHATGRVRGLLCHLCNRSLHIMDNYGSSVLAYLEIK